MWYVVVDCDCAGQSIGKNTDNAQIVHAAISMFAGKVEDRISKISVM